MNPLKLIWEYIVSFFHFLTFSFFKTKEQKFSLEMENKILSNGLEILIVNSEVFEKSTIAINIDAGHVYSPRIFRDWLIYF